MISVVDICDILKKDIGHEEIKLNNLKLSILALQDAEVETEKILKMYRMYSEQNGIVNALKSVYVFLKEQIDD